MWECVEGGGCCQQELLGVGVGLDVAALVQIGGVEKRLEVVGEAGPLVVLVVVVVVVGVGVVGELVREVVLAGHKAVVGVVVVVCVVVVVDG